MQQLILPLVSWEAHWQLSCNEPEHKHPCFAVFPIHEHVVIQEHDSVTDPVQEQPVTDELPEQEHATKAQVQESWTWPLQLQVFEAVAPHKQALVTGVPSSEQWHSFSNIPLHPQPAWDLHSWQRHCFFIWGKFMISCNQKEPISLNWIKNYRIIFEYI